MAGAPPASRRDEAAQERELAAALRREIVRLTALRESLVVPSGNCLKIPLQNALERVASLPAG